MLRDVETIVAGIKIRRIRQPNDTDIQEALSELNQAFIISKIQSRPGRKFDFYFSSRAYTLIDVLENPLGQTEQIPKMLVEQPVWHHPEGIEVTPRAMIVDSDIRKLMVEIGIYYHDMLENFLVSGKEAALTYRSRIMVLNEVLGICGQRNVEYKIAIAVATQWSMRRERFQVLYT